MPTSLVWRKAKRTISNHLNTPEQFIGYLCAREPLHGKVHTGDELNYAGYFLKYGSLTIADNVYLNDTFSAIVDRKWYAEKGIRVEEPTNDPMLTSVERKANKILFENSSGRNEVEIPPAILDHVSRSLGIASRFRERASLTWPQSKVLDAIAHCRTAALGGHRDQCSNCGHQAISYNSCRNRHCPKCQTNARDQWLAKRQQELLPVGYYHLVFSVPPALVPLMWQNKRQLFSLLFQASAATLLEVAWIEQTVTLFGIHYLARYTHRVATRRQCG